MILVIAVGVVCFSRLEFSAQFSPFGLSSNEEIEVYEHINKQFVKQENRKGSVYILEKKDLWKTREDFTRLAQITKGFEEELNTEIQSITNFSFPVKGLFGFSYRPLLRLNSHTEFERTKRKLQKMDYAHSKFISRNGKYTLLFIAEIQELSEVQKNKLSILLGKKCNGHFYSPSNDKNETKSLVLESVFIGFAALVFVLLGFYWMTKSLVGLPLLGLVILFNIALTFLFMYVFRIPFSMNMIAIPCLLVILSFSDIMHVFHYQATHFQHFNSDKELREKMLAKIGWPMLLTSVSNLIGFVIFLLISKNQMLTQMAIVSFFGVIVAYLSSRFIIVPLMDRETVYIKNANHSKFNAFALKYSGHFRRHKRLLIGAVLVLFLAASSWLYSAFKVDLKLENYVSSSSANFTSGEILSKHFFGAKSGEILVELPDDKTVWTYSHQKQIERLEMEIQKVFHPLHLISSNSLIKRYNQINVNGNPSAYRLMSNLKENDIAPYLTALGGESIISKDRKLTRISWGFKDEGISENLAKFEKLKQNISGFSGSNLKYQISGKSFLSDRSVLLYSKQLIWGLLAALFLTSVLLLFYLKSFRLAFGAFLVNAFPLVICLLLMLFSKIQINPQSLFLLSVLAGLCIDDSIYLIGYRNRTLDDLVLFPISVTTVVLGLAFFALIFSSYIWLREFSGIFIVGLLLAFIMDIFIFPLFMKFPKVFDGK